MKSYFLSGEIKKEVSVNNKKVTEKVDNLFELSVDGVYLEYYISGQKKTEINYKNNKKEGQFLSWYENGNYKASKVFRDNIQKYLAYYYYETGETRSEIRFEGFEEKFGERLIPSSRIRSANVFYKNGIRKIRYIGFGENRDQSIKCWNNSSVRIDCSNMDTRIEFD